MYNPPDPIPFPRLETLKKFIPLMLVFVAACSDNPIEAFDECRSDAPTNPGGSNIGTLQPGEVRVLEPADIPNGIDLPTVSDDRDFLFVVGNSCPRGDVPQSYLVRGDLSAPGSQGVAQLALDPAVTADAGAAKLDFAQRALEKRVRASERRRLNLTAPGPRARASGALRGSFQVTSEPVPGDILNLNVPDPKGANADLCKDFFRTQAVVASVSQKAILAVDTLDGPPLTLFTQADFDSIAAEFDNITYPTDEAFFGTPTDVDGNGRIIILFTGRVNKLTPPNTPRENGFVAGFFWAGDFFPPTGQGEGTCAQSNQAEIFYLLAPDPLGLKYGNDRSAAAVRQGTRGTIAHEFVHMINAGRRYVGQVADDFEVAWLDEGLAHMGEEVVGRRVKNFGDLQSLSHSDLLPDNNARDDYNAFFYQNLARLSYWMRRPDTSSAISALADEHLAPRGAAWALVRYASDNFSNLQPRAFNRRLVAGPDTGLINFGKATGAPLDTVLAGWLTANYADDLPGVPVLNERTQYRSYNMRSVMPPVAAALLGTPAGTYPLKVEVISGAGGNSLPATNRTGSGTYYILSVAANSGSKNVKVLDLGGAPVSFPGAHVYVFRIK